METIRAFMAENSKLVVAIYASLTALAAIMSIIIAIRIALKMTNHKKD